MDAERIFTDGLRRAADQAPAWSDDLLPAGLGARRRRPVWGWVAAAAALAVVAGSVWLGNTGSERLGVPAASPTGSPVTTTTPVANASTTPIDQPRPTASGLTSDGSRPLVGTTWSAEWLHDAPPLAGLPLAERPWLRLDPDGTVQGHDGCAAFAGRYRSTGAGLAFLDLPAAPQGCTSAGHTLLPQLGRVTGFGVHSGSLTLTDAVGGLVQLHPVTPTDTPPPAQVQLRLLNNTGVDIANVTVLAPGGEIAFGALGVGQTSEARIPSGELHRYAGLDITLVDGRYNAFIPADYVGEVPLAPGEYTYVLSTLTGQEWPEQWGVGIGLEEAGRLAGQK